MTLELQSNWTDPEHLPVDTRRYLADLLIGHLRDDRWVMLRDDDLIPIPAPGEPPAHRSLGVGRSDPRGSSHALVFTAPPHYELGIDRKHLVILDSGEYDRWCKYEAIYSHLPHLDRLLHGARREIRVFVAELSGYGTAKRLKMRRAKSVTPEQGDAALALLDVCSVVAYLGG